MDDLIKDLVSPENKSKINEYIRKEKLNEAAINKLWDVEYFRWGIIRNQTLSKERLDTIISDILKRNLKDGRKLLFYLIKYQQLDEENYKTITGSDKLAIVTLLDVWNADPIKAYKYGDYNKFLELVGDEHHLETKNRNKFMKSINHFCKKTKRTGDILEAILANYESLDYIHKIVDVLVRENFIEDVYVNKIRNKIGEERFKRIADILIARENCSLAMKAKLMLLK